MIELEQGVKPPTLVPYHVVPLELELQKQLKDLLDAGYIRLSKAIFGAPMKEMNDESLYMCINYRAFTQDHNQE